jgi:hypothetical protein
MKAAGRQSAAIFSVAANPPVVTVPGVTRGHGAGHRFIAPLRGKAASVPWG